MPVSLLPRIRTEALTDITPELLRARNIRLLMLDFDNRIVPYTTNVPTPEMDAWLKNMAKGEIPVCVVSNSKRDRVKIFCEQYGIPCITHAKKPFSKGIRECLARFGIPASQAALVGDQIYTDMLGGNCAGMQTALVEPIDTKETLLFKIKRALEIPVINMRRRKEEKQ